MNEPVSTEQATQQCLFCQIVHGAVPAKKVYEDDLFMVILDINPAAKGHLLLVPKQHYTILPQLPQVGDFYVLAKKLSRLLLKTLRCTGTTLLVANGQVAGQRVGHVFMHIIPRKEGDHLLPGQEKLVDVEMLGKVHGLVQEKLREKLGIANEKQQTLPATESTKAGQNVQKDSQKSEDVLSVVVPQEDSSSPENGQELDTSTSDDDEKTSLDDIAGLFS